MNSRAFIFSCRPLSSTVNYSAKLKESIALSTVLTLLDSYLAEVNIYYMQVDNLNF